MKKKCGCCASFYCPVHRKPWADENGKPLPDEKLKIVCQGWSEETWEQYLSTLDKEQTEFQTERYEALLERHDAKEALENFYAPEPDDEPRSMNITEARMAEAIATLLETEREIIRGLFYREETQVSLASRLGMSQPRVSALLSRALNQLHMQLEKGGKKKN